TFVGPQSGACARVVLNVDATTRTQWFNRAATGAPRISWSARFVRDSGPNVILAVNSHDKRVQYDCGPTPQATTGELVAGAFAAWWSTNVGDVKAEALQTEVLFLQTAAQLSAGGAGGGQAAMSSGGQFFSSGVSGSSNAGMISPEPVLATTTIAIAVAVWIGG